jgi:predicted metal-dependent phosphoesterase TrpH
MLGRAKVGSNGCRYRVEIDLEYGEPLTPLPGWDPPATPRIAIPDDAPWVPGDLQSHTHHSDAHGSVAELLAAAEARGLQFVAITDHNTISHHRVMAAQAAGAVLPVPGLELTTYRGHANVWGARGWVDFRIRDEADLVAAVARAHALGGLVSINHPKRQPGCIGCDWSYGVPSGIDAMEVWQGPWWLRNWESLARYDALLASGRRLSLVGGSDRHQPAGVERDPEPLRIGSPTTLLQLPERSVAAILTAIAEGRSAVSESPTGARVTLAIAGPSEVLISGQGAIGERLRCIGDAGVLDEWRIEADGDTRYPLPKRGHFLRCEVVAERSLAERERALASWATNHPLPYGITLEEVAAHPWRIALSGPLYLDSGAGVAPATDRGASA